MALTTKNWYNGTQEDNESRKGKSGGKTTEGKKGDDENMTREEAINHLQGMKDASVWIEETKALEKAITTLKEEDKKIKKAYQKGFEAGCAVGGRA